MSEIKRVVLNSFEPQEENEKVLKTTCKTVRICVSLPESNEDKCPEYNYKDELAAVKKKVKQNKDSENNVENGQDPFGDDDDDVRRIALEMEAKYGTTVTERKKKRKGRKDDYADIGVGYDESDSFIDNTDGYDEIVPQNVTTLHGGFYINSGALEFKTDDEASSEISSSSSDSESEDDKEGKRKRILETSDEEEGSDTATKKPKLVTVKNSMQQAIKKKLFSQNKIQVKKRRLIDPHKKTMKDLLREKRQDLNMSVPQELNTTVTENQEKDSLKENKKPMSITSVTDAIESVVKQTIDGSSKIANETVSTNNSDPLKKDVSMSKTIVDAPSKLGECSHETAKIEKVEIVKLPENLPSDILDIINKIKLAAAQYKDGGKVKFFTDEVNSMLLNLERKCKCLGKSSRTRVYEHLSPFVKCKKETLIRRAKNLVLEDEEKKLKNLFKKFNGQIDKLMPTLMLNHEKECQRILQKKFSQESMENEETKQLKMPRRRFLFSEDMKKLLRDLVSTKRRCLLMEGKQKDSIEEQLIDFLKKVICPCWPDGWMSLNTLKKLCTNLPKTPDPKSNNNPHKHSQNNSNSININQTKNNLTIIPINSTPKTNVSNINNTASQKLPDTTIKVTNQIKKSPDRKSLSESGVIVVNTSSKPKEDFKIEKEKDNVKNPVPKIGNCLVIDLTDGAARKMDDSRPFKFANESPENKLQSNNHLEVKPDLSIVPTLLKTRVEGDDIQMVMENLKALQKLSSPVKSENNSTSLPVSVIAYNKSNSQSGGASRTECNNKSEFVPGFQEGFQKHFINSLNHVTTTQPPSKPTYNRCS